MRTRKQLELESRISYVVDKAEELFEEFSYEKVTMDQIAKSSEISKPTLYKYFKSRDEIALSVYKKIHQKKIKVLKKHIANGKSGREKLLQFAIGFREFFSNSPESLKFQLEWDYKGLRKDKIRPEVLKGLLDSFKTDFAYMDDLFLKGVQDGSFRKDLNHEIVLDNFYLLLRTILNQILIMKDKKKWGGSLIVDHVNNYDVFVEVYLDGLRPVE